VEQAEEYRRRLRERDEEGARVAYAAMPSVSIDFSVMEKAASVRAVPLRAGWSDVGTWRSVRDLPRPFRRARHLILSDAPVLAPGVRDTAIIVSGDGVLRPSFQKEGISGPPCRACRTKGLLTLFCRVLVSVSAPPSLFEPPRRRARLPRRGFRPRRSLCEQAAERSARRNLRRRISLKQSLGRLFAKRTPRPKAPTREAGPTSGRLEEGWRS